VKRPRLNIQLSEEQQLILALLLVVLVAVSVLYCLGFAGLAVRGIWQGTPLPRDESSFDETDSLSAPSSTPHGALSETTFSLASSVGSRQAAKGWVAGERTVQLLDRNNLPGYSRLAKRPHL
jgi:hypothetical protein